MRRSLFFLVGVTYLLIGLSSCEKTGGGIGSSLDGTYYIQRVEGEYQEVSIPDVGFIMSETFVIDFDTRSVKSDWIQKTVDGTKEADSYQGDLDSSWNSFLKKYLFFPVKFVFENDGTVLVSADIYDPKLAEDWGDDSVSLSAHYKIKNGVISFTYFIGDPVSYKIQKSGSGFLLEPTEETMKEYNEDLKHDTRIKYPVNEIFYQMDWTKATFQKK